MTYKKICLCEWCINGHMSHGVKIYVGEYLSESKCECCGDDEEVHECVEEVIE